MEVLPYLYYEFHHGTLEEGEFPIVDSLLPENGNIEFEFPGDCHHHAVSSFSAKRLFPFKQNFHWCCFMK